MASAAFQHARKPLGADTAMTDELTKEETLALKLAEFDLQRSATCRAMIRLIESAQRIGKSGNQVAVLRSRMDEVAQECDKLNAIKWP